MIILDIAEWIANLLVLGLAMVMWSLSAFAILMLISVIKKWIDNFVGRFQ